MCRVVDLQQAVLAKNDQCAHDLRAALAARGTIVVNLLSSPGSGKTALLEQELLLARERGVPVAALTADLATENDALRLARSGVPVKPVPTDGLCHLGAGVPGGHRAGCPPHATRPPSAETASQGAMTTTSRAPARPSRCLCRPHRGPA